MTKEDFIRMALQAGAKPSSNPEKWDVLEINFKNFERFAKLIAAHEREECAKVCDVEAAEKMEGEWPGCAQYLANNIRARGEK